MASGRREHYIEWSEDTEVSSIEMLKGTLNEIAASVEPDDEEQDQI